MKSSCLLFFALLFVTFSCRADDTYRTYVNARFGTVVEYPANLVAPRPESDNGDGRRFVSRDDVIELTVYASNNALFQSVKGEMGRAAASWKRDGAHLTYQKAGPDWFALSGYADDDIFYEKTLYKNGVFHTLIWQYPKTLKARLDAAVNRSVRSFRTGVGLQKPVTRAVPSKVNPSSSRSNRRRKPVAPRAAAQPTPQTSGGY